MDSSTGFPSLASDMNLHPSVTDENEIGTRSPRVQYNDVVTNSGSRTSKSELVTGKTLCAHGQSKLLKPCGSPPCENDPNVFQRQRPRNGSSCLRPLPDHEDQDSHETGAA